MKDGLKIGDELWWVQLGFMADPASVRFWHGRVTGGGKTVLIYELELEGDPRSRHQNRETRGRVERRLSRTKAEAIEDARRRNTAKLQEAMETVSNHRNMEVVLSNAG